MTRDAYPLEHWASRRQRLSPSVELAVAGALRLDADGERVLEGGARLVPHDGGNHRVVALHVDGEVYCLKVPRPTHRAAATADGVLRRELGGMCVFSGAAPGRVPSPIAWSASPPWILSQWLPGQPLGNRCLSPRQLDELARATRQLLSVPRAAAEPLWDIDWPIEFLLEHLRDSLPALSERAGSDEACAEAAGLVGDWLATGDPDRFLEPSDRLVFTRGDQNLANALWDGSTIRFVDFGTAVGTIWPATCRCSPTTSSRTPRPSTRGTR